ncbi:MAG: gluconate transporter [Bacteroidales bacterium]|nr:gluconate transporter [Bacteroidales bacterium]
MSVPYILFIIISTVLLLFFFIIKLKINAFISLLVVSIYVGILAGMPLEAVLQSIEKGMGSTLGFVAVIVGLGAIFGQMLEVSGGAESLADYMIGKFGKEKSSWAMMITGFIIAIPVFLDVGFIILVPIVYALSRDAKKPVLYYGIPLLAGLAVTHSFIPPTPGPVAVADILGASLGWVILFGFLLGIPTAIIAGPVFGRFISKKIPVIPDHELYSDANVKAEIKDKPSFSGIVSLIFIPLLLMVLRTVFQMMIRNDAVSANVITQIVIFIGHPFSALIIATILSIYILGIRRGINKKEILQLSSKALGPAGIIILITGAGGVLKQILVDSGIGEIIAESVVGSSFSPILLAWILAAIVRITQGSATVAMITAAGFIAPILDILALSEIHTALVVLAIASGATILSHVNDSGFWLVGKYLGLNEKQTLQSWTVMETIISLCGLALCLTTSIIL